MGIEHLALTSANAAASAQALKSLGYEVRFVENGIPNNILKKPFLQEYRPSHSIAYCWSRKGASIEIVQHGDILPGLPAHYNVLFSKEFGGLTDPGGEAGNASEIFSAAEGGRDCKAHYWPDFGTNVWCAENAGDLNAVSSMLYAGDFNASREFWGKLGFVETQTGRTAGTAWSLLELKTILPRWSSKLVLVETAGRKNNYYLDSPGFSCLAFLSNDVKADSARLSSGAGIFKMDVGGKAMEISMLRGPSGEIVELIELKK